jgi:uncharacterized protein
MKQPRHLVIFARFPVAGAGKRRLAVSIGNVRAAHFQRVRLNILVRRLAHDPRWTTWIAVTPDHAAPWPPWVRCRAQGRGDLGQRMGRIMTGWPPGPVIVVGTDIPGVVAADVAAAFKALGGNDAVFGPASDGGYWLVGFRRTPRVPRAFGSVRWSTKHALADTSRNLDGARIGAVRTLSDVDTAEDLAHHQHWNRLVAPGGQ